MKASILEMINKWKVVIQSKKPFEVEAEASLFLWKMGN